MRMHPIVSSLFKKNRSSSFVAIFMMAFTIAVLANSFSIITAKIERLARPTGMNEADVFVVSQSWVGIEDPGSDGTVAELDAQVRSDIAGIQSLPSIQSAAIVNSIPLLNEMRVGSVSTQSGQAKGQATAALYYVDENALSTLGLKLTSGRNFSREEVMPQGVSDVTTSGSVIITEALAKKMFGDDRFLGREFYLNGNASPSRVIGIVSRLQTPNTSEWGNSFAYNSVLIPGRLISASSRYIVRAKPGMQSSAMAETREELYRISRARVIGDQAIVSFGQLREKAYQNDSTLAFILTSVCAILIVVTTCGIAGVSIYWVSKRRRHVGIRRALGATRGDIFKLFIAENLVLTATAAVVGAIFSVLMSLLLAKFGNSSQMGASFIIYASLGVAACSVLSVLRPAIKAAQLPPMQAVRGALVR